jgi:FlaA1/EpsC-like NDP-sugar epimerase
VGVAMPYLKMYSLVSKLRNRHFFLIDLLIMLCIPLAALYIRVDGDINWARYQYPLMLYTVLFLVPKLSVFISLGLYNRVWRTASVDELARLIVMGFLIIILQSVIYTMARSIGLGEISVLPHSLAFLDGALCITIISTFRFSIRLLERANQRLKNPPKGERVLIIGAGYAGVSIAEEMQRTPELGMIPVAFVDDDKNKKHARIRGINVAGDTFHIPAIVQQNKIHKIIIAMPSAPGTKIRRIVSECSKLNIETMTVPGIYEILNGKISIDTIRKIQVDDLLRRAPIKTDSRAVAENTRGKCILVTGAGGSIGSEICRQILRNNPAELILLGHGENSIFEIEQELAYIKRKYLAETKVRSFIADIRHIERIDEVFAEVRPEIVYHAAAHKHVPLMELNPKEAITNNIMGTKNLIDTCIRYNVNDFIMISSDKAVNPTNIMGASKRCAEMIVLEVARKYNKKFAAVRFGNVLGSRGSVLHTFKRQIANGGPVTITHPDIRRYFMTIPEAVQLVLQASVLSKGGEVFLLDMGEPIKLIDLAKDIIRLSGLREGQDIKIDIIGLRPGEKLFEELFIKGENYERTKHEKVLIAKNASSFVNPSLAVKVSDLIFNIADLTSEQIYSKVCNIVPEFEPTYVIVPERQSVVDEEAAKVSIA